MIASPRPVPWPTSLVVKNGSKIRGRTSAAMPGAGVADRHDDARRRHRGVGRDRRCGRAAARAGDRVLRVDQDVEERLLQQQPDRRRPTAAFGPLLADDLDVGLGQRGLRARERARQDAIDAAAAGARSAATPVNTAGCARSSRRDPPRGRSAAARALRRGVAPPRRRPISSSRCPSTPCSGLFISCAMPATNWPSDASFSDCASRSRSAARSASSRVCRVMSRATSTRPDGLAVLR